MKYTDIQGWFTWPEIYDRMAAEVPNGGMIVELGVWKGQSIAYLAEKVKSLGKTVQLIGIDRFDAYGCDAYKEAAGMEPLFDQCRRNLDECGHSEIQLIRDDCIAAASRFPNKSINFIFVDDLHNDEHIKKELQAWLPKLIRPTWIAGDDSKFVIRGVGAILPQFKTERDYWTAEII